MNFWPLVPKMSKWMLQKGRYVWHKRYLRWSLLGSFSLGLCYLTFCNYTEPTEVGIVRNRISGEMSAQLGGGWHFSAPWVSVAVVDARPMRVSVPSAGHGYSAKLVQFNPDQWREFVKVEGFYYYWWANRFSFNWSYDEEYRGVRDIFRGYAYSSKHYEFLTLLNEYQ